MHYFRISRAAHIAYEKVRRAEGEYVRYDLEENHMFFDKMDMDDVDKPTTPHLDNKRKRLLFTQNLVQMDNVLTKQPASDPNFVTIREDFRPFGHLGRTKFG